MRFFVEESGTFAPAGQPGSWCTVAAYMLSEAQYPRALTVLRAYKLAAGADPESEFKNRDVDEETYCQFLVTLQEVGGVLACVATDASLYYDINADRIAQANLVRAGYPGDDGRVLCEQVLALPDQLFVEMMCRLELTMRAVQIGTLYFVRRDPSTLGRFDWWCDEKKRIEKSFRTLWVGVARELSRRHPLRLGQGGNYRLLDAIARIEDRDGQPQYDASSLVVDRMQFPKSHDEPGLQVADWLAWGCRRCLRGEFSDVPRVTRLLGSLLRRLRDDAHAIVPLLFARAAPDTVPNFTRAAILGLTRHARRIW